MERACEGEKAADTERSLACRFIPTRDALDSQASFRLLPSSNAVGKRRIEGGMDAQKGAPRLPSRLGRCSLWLGRRQLTLDFDSLDEADRTFDALLRTELFGAEFVDPASLRSSHPQRSQASSPSAFTSSRSRKGSRSRSHEGSPAATPSSKPVFSFSPPARKRLTPGEVERVVGGAQGLDSPTHERYSTSPIKQDSQKLLASPRRAPRMVSRVPYKVLDAPALADDYYLNLIDWSSTNVLAVGLGAEIYLWSAVTSQVTKLVNLGAHSPPDSVTSVNWVGKGSHLAVGTKLGNVHIFDAAVQRLIRTMSGHTARVGALAWNGPILSSGSHDRLILHRDVRVPAHSIGKITAHRQEVCGLKWNVSENKLASGGNDNRLFVYDQLNEVSESVRFRESAY